MSQIYSGAIAYFPRGFGATPFSVHTIRSEVMKVAFELVHKIPNRLGVSELAPDVPKNDNNSSLGASKVVSNNLDCA